MPTKSDNTIGGGKLPRHLAKKMKKKRKKEKKDSQAEDENTEIDYPYQVDENDHCESPLLAYQDISPVLDFICAKLGKTRATLRIYDPYYCEGAMKAHLLTCGFSDVYNKMEDFYKVIEAKACPDYDVLVTNPPYSNDHVPRLLSFATREKKPFFLLMPNWCYTKEYYSRITQAHGLFYISSSVRYMYTTPKGRRQKKSGKYTSPFPSFWYCGLGRGPLSTEDCNETQATLRSYSNRVHMSTSTSLLPLFVAHDTDTRKRKERDKMKRKKNKDKKRGRECDGGKDRANIEGKKARIEELG